MKFLDHARVQIRSGGGGAGDEPRLPLRPGVHSGAARVSTEAGRPTGSCAWRVGTREAIGQTVRRQARACPESRFATDGRRVFRRQWRRQAAYDKPRPKAGIEPRPAEGGGRGPLPAEAKQHKVNTAPRP